MPLNIDRTAARELAPRLDEALELVRNEFEGLDTHRQYRNAFARLLKPDPLGRVSMMGTDQRDMFVPELRRTIVQCVPPEGHIFDLGAGDGQTFALVADSVPNGTRVSIEEPNPGYLADYIAYLQTQKHLRPGLAIEAGFTEMDAITDLSGRMPPPDESIDLCLAVHMIYFVDDLAGALVRMTRFLKRGGALFVVATDETDNYTGRVFEEFTEHARAGGEMAQTPSSFAERRRLLGTSAEGGGGIVEVLRAAGISVELDSTRQPSRLYGHTLADLIALSSIAALAGIDGLDKFEAAAKLLRDKPESVGLRIEDGGPRKGMWSVTQPQWVAVIRRTN